MIENETRHELLLPPNPQIIDKDKQTTYGIGFYIKNIHEN